LGLRAQGDEVKKKVMKPSGGGCDYCETPVRTQVSAE
jgi:hypothetical protein